MLKSHSYICNFTIRNENFSLRFADDRDIPHIRRLVNEAYQELLQMGLNYTASYQDEDVTRERCRQGRTVVVENRQDDIVGSVVLHQKNYFTERHSAYISQLAIANRYKGIGLGTYLMVWCENLAKREGFHSIQLDTAKPAHHLIKWYKNRNYQAIGSSQWEGKSYESWIFEKIFET